MTMYMYRHQELNTTISLNKFNSGNITLYIEKIQSTRFMQISK